MAKQTFVTGSVLTAAQMNTLQENDYNATVSTKTASYVLVAFDVGTTIVQNVATANTVTVNTGLFTAGDTLRIQNIGAGVATITAGTATVNTANTLALPQWGSGILYFTSTSTAIFFPSAGALSATPPSFSLLNTGNITPSGSAFTISGLSPKNTFAILFRELSSTSGSAFLRIAFNNSIGGNPAISASAENNFLAAYAATNGYGNFGFGTEVRIAKMSTQSTTFMSGGFIINGCNSENIKFFTSIGSGGAGIANGQTSIIGNGTWDNGAVISQVTVSLSTGTFDSGEMYVYGA
jgi:hypothetical protein